jgi:hypothetical protein
MAANTASIGVSSARAIAKLVRIHQEEYGISRSHPFALYALASAFSVITSRSALGQKIRVVFKKSFQQAMAAKSKDGADGKQRIRGVLSPKLPDEVKEILEEDYSDHVSSSSSSSSPETEEEDPTSSSGGGPAGGKGRSKGDEDSEPDEDASRSTSSDSEKEQRHGQGAGALCEMLCRYEALSLGKEAGDSKCDDATDT